MEANVGDVVSFQAYEDGTPVEGKVNRKGTLKELNKHQLDETDTRIFYELVALTEPHFVFTVTTGAWIFNKTETQQTNPIFNT